MAQLNLIELVKHIGLSISGGDCCIRTIGNSAFVPFVVFKYWQQCDRSLLFFIRVFCKNGEFQALVGKKDLCLAS